MHMIDWVRAHIKLPFLLGTTKNVLNFDNERWFLFWNDYSYMPCIVPMNVTTSMSKNTRDIMAHNSKFSPSLAREFGRNYRRKPYRLRQRRIQLLQTAFLYTRCHRWGSISLVLHDLTTFSSCVEIVSVAGPPWATLKIRNLARDLIAWAQPPNHILWRGQHRPFGASSFDDFGRIRFLEPSVSQTSQ